MSDQVTNDVLAELLAWVRFQNMGRLRDVLGEMLRDRKDYDAFELSDGTRSQADIAKKVGVSQPTVSRLWARLWRQLGLVRDVGGRVTHISKAADVGVARPAR